MPAPSLTPRIRWLLVLAASLCPLFSLAQTPPTIIISEINYNPPGSESNTPGDPGYALQTEFIEIKNVGTVSINLSTIGFSIWDDEGAISLVNTATLAAGARAVFPRIQTSFASRYPSVAVAGVITNRSFSNSGERIRLRYKVSGVDTTFFSLTYGTRAPWPSLPDGSGFTLVASNPNANDDPNDPLNWRVSTSLYGSPGADDPDFPVSPIVINELDTRNDSFSNVDSFEIANLSDSPVDIGNWFLSDDNDNLKRFKIPSPTIVPARGFLVFTQAQLGFGISGAGGDELKLIAADAAGNFTGYKHGAQPGAAINQRSFNRVVSLDGREFFQPSLTNTIGASNSGVYLGPVVFSEINYNPSASTFNPAVVKTEYVELVNRSAQPVNLFSNITVPPAVTPTHFTWKVKGIYGATNLDFVFPANVSLAAGEVVLLIPAKTGLTEANNISAFRTTNKVPASVTKIFVYYGYNNNVDATSGDIPADGNILSNGGQILELGRPELITSINNTTPPVTTYDVKYLTEDYAAYDDSSEWPQKADGDGPLTGAPGTAPTYYGRSLVRIDANRFAGDPRAWDNSVAHGGTPGYAVFPGSGSVVVNEVLAHSDLTDFSHESRTDFIELHNPTASPVNITGWWLTNNPDSLAAVYDKRLANPAYVIAAADSVYEIPSTTIPAGGFWSVNGDNDDNVNTTPPVGFFGRAFSLNSRGDNCYLVAYDSVSNRLLGYVHGFNFDATENPVSLIRYLNTEGRETFLAAQSITTSFTTANAFPTGAANSAPKVPAVSITEFMYDAPVGGYEFIEIYNSGNTTAALYDNFNEIPGNVISPRHNANNGWQISGIDFKFASAPGNRPTLAAGEAIIITNAPSAAAFRTYFTNTPAQTRIFLWSTGLFSNQGERIKLQKPDQEDTVNAATVVPYINVDEVSYRPDAPWAPIGFGGGYSLERKSLNNIGDDATNWQRSPTVLGTPGFASAAVPQASNDTYTVNEDTLLTVAAPGVLANDVSPKTGVTLTASVESAPSPASGTLNLASDGSFTFQPAANFNGAVSFTYKAIAGTYASPPATVSITVNPVNDAPAFTADPINLNATEDSPFTGQLSASDPDVGAALSFTKLSGPAWLTVSTTGALSGTPTNDEVGLNSFSVQVSDGTASATATLNLTVANTNDAPVFAADPINLSATEGAAFTGQLSASDVDVGAVLSFTKLSGPAWLTVSTTGALSGTPTNANAGPNAFSVQVSDGTASATATLNLTVAALPGFSTFASDNFTQAERNDPLISGSEADPDGDGISNLLEYALGTNPRQPSSLQLPVPQLTTVSTDQFLALSFRRLKTRPDLTYTVEVTTNFTVWTPVTTAVGSPVDNADGTETVILRSTTAASPTTTSQHIRLRVTLNP